MWIFSYFPACTWCRTWYTNGTRRRDMGVETWVQDANNEFAVPVQLRDSTNVYRGGIRLEYNRWHITLEEGGTTYKNDDQASFNGVNYGDRTTSLLGTTSVLNNLIQTYGVRGDSTYTRALATASPLPWLDLSGQFLYSKPTTTSRYFDLANGNFAMLSTLLLYSGQFNLASSSARVRRHTLVNGGVEVPAIPTDANHRLGHFRIITTTVPALA